MADLQTSFYQRHQYQLRLYARQTPQEDTFSEEVVYSQKAGHTTQSHVETPRSFVSDNSHTAEEEESLSRPLPANAAARRSSKSRGGQPPEGGRTRQAPKTQERVQYLLIRLVTHKPLPQVHRRAGEAAERRVGEASSCQKMTRNCI